MQVIKSLNKYARSENIDVTLVDLQSSTVYSGMVPGTWHEHYWSNVASIDSVHAVLSFHLGCKT